MSKKNYLSTIGQSSPVSASQAIAKGLAPDGGLFVPEFIDNISFDLERLKDLSYPDLAKAILGDFLDFTEEELDEAVDGAYRSGKFDTQNLVAVTDAGDHSILELHHGPTAAFKDMALTILPYLVTRASKKSGEANEIVILTATSGDTGKAALEGFKDVPGTRIIVFYPKDGVSDVQERQMLSTGGDNTDVIGIFGNFDDTQTGVKHIFSDKAFNEALDEKGYTLSSANSINIGRLLPQIVYYYYTYFDLLRNGKIKEGERVNFCVPTGNFGDILAGYYAKKTGLPVGKLICASNQNKVLTDFFESGDYDKNRAFLKSVSPSMDILISSNLERLLYDKLRDPDQVASLMKGLKTEGAYRVDPSLFPEFFAGYASEEDTLSTIKRTFEEEGLLIDPHTAVAEKVYRDYRDATGDDTYTVVLSTASPYKFSGAVYEALFGEAPGEDPFELQEKLSERTGTKIPFSLRDLRSKPVLHHKTAEPDAMEETVRVILS